MLSIALGNFQKDIPYEQARKCLSELKIPANTAYHTIMHLEHGVSEVYSYRHISMKSEQSVQRLAEGCRLAIHKVEVDLPEELQSIKNDLVSQSGASDFEQLRKLDKSFPALDFHQRLQEIFTRLRDAHTVYQSPLRAQIMPVFYFGKMGMNLKFRVLQGGEVASGNVTSGNVTSAKAIVQVTSVDALGWVTVKRVGVPGGWSRDPFDWLTQWADAAVGGYKSRGGRLNSLLNNLAMGVFDAEPESGELELTFEDDQPVVYPVFALMRNMDVQEMEVAINTNPRWQAIKDWMDADLHLQGSARAAAIDEALAAAEGVSQFEPPTFSEIMDALQPHMQQAASESVAAARRLGSLGTGEWRVIGTAGTNQDVVAYELEEAVVLKVKTFAPVDFGQSFLQSLIRLYQKAVVAAWPHDRLILDLADNGGGAIEFSNLLTYLVAPRHRTPKQLCSQYRVLVHRFWRAWLESFGGQWVHLVQEADSISADELRNRFERLQGLLKLQQMIKAPLPLNALAVALLVTEALRLDEAGMRQKWKQLLERRNSYLFNDLAPTELLMGKDTDDGWFPFGGDVENPNDSQYFDPPTLPFRELEEHKWGRDEANYSMRYLFACDLVFDPMFRVFSDMEKAKFEWKEIAIITNGMCGSACSLIATKLQFAEGATIFTYGGVPGEPMDHSAFAGGNVLNYKEFWPMVFYSAIIGDIIYGPDTPIGDKLREPGARERHYSKTLLLPLPTSAVATFNYNMMHITELGPQALPREWYLIPAHKNYEVWIDGGMNSYSKRHDLYERIQGENWSAVRRQFSDSVARYDCAADPPPWAGVRPKPATPLDHDKYSFDLPDERFYWAFAVVVQVCYCCLCIGGVTFCVVKCCSSRQARQVTWVGHQTPATVEMAPSAVVPG